MLSRGDRDWALIMEFPSLEGVSMVTPSRENQNRPYCPECHSTEIVPFKKYDTVHNGLRFIFKCSECNATFLEITGTPMEHLKSPISKVASVLKIRSEGVGLRVTGRILGIHKNTVSKWEQLFADLKETLMLYSFCHDFVSFVFELKGTSSTPSWISVPTRPPLRAGPPL